MFWVVYFHDDDDCHTKLFKFYDTFKRRTEADRAAARLSRLGRTVRVIPAELHAEYSSHIEGLPDEHL